MSVTKKKNKKSFLTSFAYDHFLETTNFAGKSPSHCITASSEIVNQCVAAWRKVRHTKANAGTGRRVVVQEAGSYCRSAADLKIVS